jgi:hypothetical protein
MCNPSTSASTSSIDYTAEPEEITQLRNQVADAMERCCTCAYVKSGRFNPTLKIQQLRYDGVTLKNESDIAWTGEVYVASDGTRGTVTVNHRIKALNKTADTVRYPATMALSNEDLAARLAGIPAAIETAWNARPYKLKITDAICGERLFDVRFHVRMVEGDEHYVIDFVNVPYTVKTLDIHRVESRRSYILSPNWGKWNIADPHSATDDDRNNNVLEPHEFGHMIGLKDEYPDAEYDRGGVQYDFPDGRRETAAVNDELMGTMGIKKAEPLRYCVTIAYAAIGVLEANGIAVTDCVIQ